MVDENHVFQGSVDLDSLPMEEIIANATIEASSVEDIHHKQLSDILEKYTFALVTGLIDPEVIRSARRRIEELYNPDVIRPATGEHPSEIMDNFHKLSLGGAEHSGVYRPRCMGTMYNPVWADDIYGLREVFRTTARVRNILYGFDTDYAIDEVEGDFWTAARVHHYPAGGGFLVSHLDNIVPVVQRKSGLSNQYFQPVIVMSKKGEGEDCDFKTGGGFFKVGSRHYFYEETCNLGDIIIYSGETIHGVADIDLHKTLDTRKPEGRMAGFVTLYKHFDRKKQLEDFVEMSEHKVVR